MIHIRNPELRDKETWKGLVYRLLYPGILGSMVFDLADPVRIQLQLAKLGLLFITCGFVIDFLHMTVNLKAERTTAKSHPALDTAIAFAFAVGYFALAKVTDERVSIAAYRDYCAMSLSALCVAYGLVFVYELWDRSGPAMTRLLPFVFSFLGLATIVWARPDGMLAVAAVIATSCVSMALYLVHVFAVAAPQPDA